MSRPLRRRLRAWRRQVTLGSFAVATNHSIEMDGYAIAALEDRISAIEELVAARWPRSMFLRRRLARELRASSATYAWAGETFAARRGEAMTEDIHNRMTSRPSRTASTQ